LVPSDRCGGTRFVLEQQVVEDAPPEPRTQSFVQVRVNGGVVELPAGGLTEDPELKHDEVQRVFGYPLLRGRGAGLEDRLVFDGAIECDRGIRLQLVDVRVHAVSVRREPFLDRTAVGAELLVERVEHALDLSIRVALLPRVDVHLEEGVVLARPDELGQSPPGRVAEHVHLPHAVLRRDIAEREPRLVESLRIDMGDAELVPVDRRALDRRVLPLHVALGSELHGMEVLRQLLLRDVVVVDELGVHIELVVIVRAEATVASSLSETLPSCPGGTMENALIGSST
jgi:hypothetical protein